jgi:predicted transcriptional regulator
MAEQGRPRTSHEDLLRMVTDIVASYVRSTKVASNQLPEIIAKVYHSLDQPEAPAAARQEPAVPIRRSVTPEYLICLEDGKKLKMLKRYLMTTYNLTPEQYREKWDLPKDYPMVAPNYALRRSTLAKESGLGRRREAASAAPSSARRRSPPEGGKRRGRPPKSAG